MRKIYILGLIALAATVSCLAWAEQVTLSTYYPAPYGVYKQLQAQNLILPPTTSVPQNPAPGTIFYSDGIVGPPDFEKGLWMWNGEEWERLIAKPAVQTIARLSMPAGKFYPGGFQWIGGDLTVVSHQAYEPPRLLPLKMGWRFRFYHYPDFVKWGHFINGQAVIAYNIKIKREKVDGPSLRDSFSYLAGSFPSYHIITQFEEDIDNVVGTSQTFEGTAAFDFSYASTSYFPAQMQINIPRTYYSCTVENLSVKINRLSSEQ